MKTKKDNKTNRLKHIAYLLKCEVGTVTKNLNGTNGNEATKKLVRYLIETPNLFQIESLHLFFENLLLKDFENNLVDNQ